MDHGVFVPFLLIYPQADVPILQLSLDGRLDPALHLRIGRALTPLRDEGVLIVGSGMSYHNLTALFSGRGNEAAASFDAWLSEAVRIRRHATGSLRHGAVRPAAARRIRARST